MGLVECVFPERTALVLNVAGVLVLYAWLGGSMDISAVEAVQVIREALAAGAMMRVPVGAQLVKAAIALPVLAAALSAVQSIVSSRIQMLKYT